jgi:hypothetical protein
MARILARGKVDERVKARGEAKKELETAGSDPNVDDTEGTASEDTWLGRGSHGWFDRLLRQRRKQ